MKMKREEPAASGKNCLSCTRCETVFDTRTGKEWHRCSLDRDMRVNRRMHCDEWTGMVTINGTGIAEAVTATDLHGKKPVIM